jgi:hypothetical protein
MSEIVYTGLLTLGHSHPFSLAVQPGPIRAPIQYFSANQLDV